MEKYMEEFNMTNSNDNNLYIPHPTTSSDSTQILPDIKSDFEKTTTSLVMSILTRMRGNETERAELDRILQNDFLERSGTSENCFEDGELEENYDTESSEESECEVKFKPTTYIEPKESKIRTPNDNEIVIGIYTRGERREKIRRFREKRQSKNRKRRIMYLSRSEIAKNKPREGCRFIKSSMYDT